MKSVFNCFLICRDLNHVLKYCIKSGMQTRAGNEYMLKAFSLVKKADTFRSASWSQHCISLCPSSLQRL